MIKNLLLFQDLADAVNNAWEKLMDEIDSWLNAAWQKDKPLLQPLHLHEQADKSYDH